MSTPALALPLSRGSRRLRRRHALSRTPLQWHEVPIAASVAVAERRGDESRRWLVALAALVVIALHSVGTWYLNRISLLSEARPKVAKLAVEFVHPPQPKKVEPPPPPAPPRPHRERTPPPIQTRSVVASDVPVAAPAESVAAGAPAEPA